MATTTFLFTDIEGSTRLWESHPDQMRVALEGHDRTIAAQVGAHGGRVFKHTGDGAVAAFGSPSEAIDAALAIQRELRQTPHPEVGNLRVRMGIHAGDADERDGDFFGPTLNRGARLMSAGHGGQILVSATAAHLSGREADLIDLGEHRLRDLGRPERIFQVDHGDPTEHPPLATLRTVLHNLPVLTTSFVGRKHDMQRLIGLVHDSRLVTITGVGGTGKTRLALQVTAELSSEFADGVWLVELAALSDPDLMDGACAAALGVGQEEGKSLRESLLDWLADRSVLLVVDNCEHLIEDAADMVDSVLRRSPRSKVVATSRELLGVPGEVAFGLRSLSFPRRDGPVDAASLLEYDAARLFIERAQAAAPGFEIGDDTAGPVAEICRRLDGMPLALELAASRVRTFPPQKIAELLDQRFRLLTGGSRTALPRQQTLAATIDWSYRLLEGREQTLLRRLSVFHGGFDYEAAAGVTASDPIDELDLMELLPSLVDKSLVIAEASDGDARYLLLETIRQFARDLFEETDEAEPIRRAHARHYESLSREAGRHIRGPDEATWWSRIEAELDNLRAAMTWALEAGDPALAMSIATGSWRFWWFRSLWTEGAGWLERILDASDELPDALEAQGLLAYGSLREWAPGTRGATESLARSVELYRALHRSGAPADMLETGYTAALINLGVQLANRSGDWDSAEPLFEEALEVAQELDDTTAQGVALGNLSLFHARRGEFEDALRLARQAVSLARAIDSQQLLADATRQLGDLYVQGDDLDSAYDTLAAAADLYRRAGQTEIAAYTNVRLNIVEAVRREDAGGETLAESLRTAAAHAELATAPGFRRDLLEGRILADARLADWDTVAVGWAALEREFEDDPYPSPRAISEALDAVRQEMTERLPPEAIQNARRRALAMSLAELRDFLAG